MIKIDLRNLSSLIEFKNGRIAPKILGKYPIYGGNGILGYCNQWNYEDTLIIGRVGAYCGSIHVAKGKCWVSDNAIAGIPKENQVLDFNYYLFGELNLNKKQIGSSQPLLTQGILNSIDVKIPTNLQAQKQIAKVLSDLDAKIEVNNKINQELEAMAKTLYDYWFVQFDFPDANGKPYKSSGGKMVFNEALKREIPEGWEVKELSEISELKAGGDKPKSFTKEQTKENTIPIYSNGITNEGLYGYTNAAKINKESITISARGTIGYCVLRKTPFVPIIRLISVSPNKANEIAFLFESIKNLVFENSGSVQQQLTVPQVSKLKLVSPPNHFIKKYDLCTRSGLDKIEINKKENQKLSELRDWLLPMLMNGQVSVASLRGTKQSHDVNTNDTLGMVAEEGETYNS
ncbi:restriction endonuclease subunit S [Lacinutrix algicola]|uniref:restriction endonuclease subunit S n=1 Tax=Lacinutrix algicola TaxID=342954 RepID=UPI0006E379A4|nr:restriction endonuclease subunit S [Lacinutrix algicola]